MRRLHKHDLISLGQAADAIQPSMTTFSVRSRGSVLIGSPRKSASHGLMYSFTSPRDDHAHIIRAHFVARFDTARSLELRVRRTATRRATRDGIVSFLGATYEAFDTSGGMATMCDTYRDRIGELNYKTIRYPDISVICVSSYTIWDSVTGPTC